MHSTNGKVRKLLPFWSLLKYSCDRIAAHAVVNRARGHVARAIPDRRRPGTDCCLRMLCLTDGVACVTYPASPESQKDIDSQRGPKRMTTHIVRFCTLLPFLQTQSFADIAPFNPQVVETVRPVTSSPAWPSWVAIAGTGTFLCVAVLLAVFITRKSRQARDARSSSQV